MAETSSRLVVFISGAFVSNNCWEEWILYFEREGFTCIAPAWPHKDASSEELRNRPVTDVISSNTLASVTDHFLSIINALPEKPILIGHSHGGLIVQLLLQKQVAVAGVAVHSFPPQGVSKFWFPLLRIINSARTMVGSGVQTYLISFKTWRRTVANKLPIEQQIELYYEYAIPESKTVINESYNSTLKIDFNKPHAPLLFTSGSSDKLMPASLNYNNYKRYSSCDSITKYVEFKGHTHLVFGVPAWKEEAHCIVHWLEELN
jgi:pimeloyl-ACP methyl ester carboxylesterase